jgi:hypothetical protein
MTRDGRVVMSNGLRLFATDGKAQEDLGALPGWPHIGGLGGSVWPAADGKRFGLVLGTNPYQLTLVDRNPKARGTAPALEDITVSAKLLTTDGTTEITVSARITNADVQYAGVLLMRDGMALGADPIQLSDDPTANLADSKDGKILTARVRLPAGLKVPPGPLTLRFSAINKAAHALVVDVDGVEAINPMK